MNDNSFEQTCKPLDIEKGIETGKLCFCKFSKETTDKLRSRLEQLNEAAKEFNLNPTWQCSKCGWKSSWRVSKTALTLNPYIPLFVTGTTDKKIGWVCPDCMKINKNNP